MLKAPKYDDSDPENLYKSNNPPEFHESEIVPEPMPDSVPESSGSDYDFCNDVSTSYEKPVIVHPKQENLSNSFDVQREVDGSKILCESLNRNCKILCSAFPETKGIGKFFNFEHTQDEIEEYIQNYCYVHSRAKIREFEINKADLTYKYFNLSKYNKHDNLSSTLFSKKLRSIRYTKQQQEDIICRYKYCKKDFIFLSQLLRFKYSVPELVNFYYNHKSMIFNVPDDEKPDNENNEEIENKAIEEIHEKIEANNVILGQKYKKTHKLI